MCPLLLDLPRSTIEIQCLTLGPTVALKAQVASQEDKEWLSKALFYLREQNTISLEGDVLKLSGLING